MCFELSQIMFKYFYLVCCTNLRKVKHFCFDRLVMNMLSRIIKCIICSASSVCGWWRVSTMGLQCLGACVFSRCLGVLFSRHFLTVRYSHFCLDRSANFILNASTYYDSGSEIMHVF